MFFENNFLQKTWKWLTKMVGCWNLGLKMIPNDRPRSSLGSPGGFGKKILKFQWKIQISAKHWIYHLFFGFFWPKSPGDPSDDLGRSFGIIFSSKFQHPTMFVNHFYICCNKEVQTNTWKSNFSGIPWRLGPTGPCLCDRARTKTSTKWYRDLRTTKWHPSYASFTFQVNRQKNSS